MSALVKPINSQLQVFDDIVTIDHGESRITIRRHHIDISAVIVAFCRVAKVNAGVVMLQKQTINKGPVVSDHRPLIAPVMEHVLVLSPVVSFHRHSVAEVAQACFSAVRQDA
jgi:hypothetical protein